MKRTPEEILPIINRETGRLEGFRPAPGAAPKPFTVNRRAFLRGAGAVAIGLPFLEGLPERSAWAADAAPVFSFFIVGACGVVGNKFFPSATGALTTAGLAGHDRQGDQRARAARAEPAVRQEHQLPERRPEGLRARRGVVPVADGGRAGLDGQHDRRRAGPRRTW